MTTTLPDNWKAAFRQAMFERVGAAVDTFSGMGVRAPVPWPNPSDLSARKGALSDFCIALWNVSAAAVDFSAANLSEGDQARARLSGNHPVRIAWSDVAQPA